MTRQNKRLAPTRWYWVRHAPVVGATGELYDTPDEPADVSDTAAFEALAASLPKKALWLTSDLHRARQTADSIAAAGNTPRERLEDERLAEQHFGDWFGRGSDLALLSRHLGSQHNFWMVDAATRPNNGESFLDLMARAAAAIQEHSYTYREQTIVAISHGGVIRAAIAHALGLEPDRALGIMVENLSTTRLDYYPGPGKGGDWRVVFLNKRAR
ncbi:MAG: histidine phosphatase family protein [Pseudomonadota bacterium]